MDLELVSTAELIKELLRRKTFMGVLVHADQEVRSDAWDGERVFCIRFSDRLNAGSAARLLEVVSSRMAEDRT